MIGSSNKKLSTDYIGEIVVSLVGNYVIKMLVVFFRIGIIIFSFNKKLNDDILE